MKRFMVIVLSLVVFASCANKLSDFVRVQNYMVDNAVVAHRGCPYWTPEHTEAGFRWARNIGADYLEVDLHRTQDGALIIKHDATFERTTDVAVKFPGREKDGVEKFVFAEILQLDAGSWFNERFPDRARENFAGLEILVFEDVLRIAEGKRIKRDANGKRIFSRSETGEYIFEYEDDPAFNGNLPGVYFEFKIPENYPEIEEQVYEVLTRTGWNILEGESIDEKTPAYIDGKVNIGKTRGKIVSQTFSRQGLENVFRVFEGKILSAFLVGTADDFTTEESIDEIIEFAKSMGAQLIGSNLETARNKDGMSPIFSQRLRAAGLKSHVYTFTNVEQMEKYHELTEGQFTDRADLTLDFFHEKGIRPTGKQGGTPEEILNALGY